ncbi:MAG: TetR/AcrR family transcriptional regulator [Anaerolineae bacterium]|jgi:AcrR family transcriptional regulator|nr:TetR/AcrR family transcriptional regulator [Anaerolineae bacterium]
MNDETTMRKQPKQARSQKRVDQLLDAAAQVFAEIGYESATTNQIAARAKVSIGSLYQFFPNKEALLEALLARYTEGLRESLTIDQRLNCSDTIRVMIEGMARFESSHEAFKTLFMDSNRVSQMHTEIVQQIDALLAIQFPTFDPAPRRQCAIVGVAIVKALMPLSGPPDYLAPEVVLNEVQVSLKSYLRAVLLREAIPLPDDLV